MKKRILCIITAICMIICTIPITANAMDIFVDFNISGIAKMRLGVESGDSIDNVKEKINKKTNIDINKQELYFNGKRLQDDRTLADYNIYKENTIALEITPTEVSSSDELTKAANHGGIIKLNNNIECGEIQIKDNNFIILDLNGKTIKNNTSYYTIGVNDSAFLAITDSAVGGRLEGEVLLFASSTCSLSGNAKIEKLTLTSGNTNLTMDDNAEITGELLVHEQSPLNPIIMRGNAKITGSAIFEYQSENSAGFKLEDNAYINAIMGATFDKKIKIEAKDKAVINYIKDSVDFELFISDNAKIGSPENNLILRHSNLTIKDNAQLIGKTLQHYYNPDSVFTLEDNAQIIGDLVLFNDAKMTFKMKDNAVLKGFLICEDKNISIVVQDNAKIDGDIEANDNTVDGKVICSGEIKSGIFNADVENNGTITGGTFLGKVTGNGTIADSATVNVNFDLDGGTGTTFQKVLRGQKLAEPTKPYKSAYTFDGWYNGEQKYDFDAPVFNEITLTAKWTYAGGSSWNTTEPTTEKPTEPTTKPNKQNNKKNTKGKTDKNSLSAGAKKDDANSNNYEKSPLTGNTSIFASIISAGAGLIILAATKKRKDR
ncbi:ubiquitin-like protein [uncultured Eubacterium sp.]|uniref:ubiquitin-like protein n=1 Tax=uncultured Eubacterium sp. TaxID=165185 RepID=UPI0026294598|nr:ubiquitin-like protein [uncultured Eubacterium sp.]